MPDAPATTYGLIWDPEVASQPTLAGMKDWDGWADVPTTTIPLSTPLYATEQYLSSAPIERVVGGEPFRTGYDPYVIVDAQGRYVVIDGHHRAAMHLALGLDDMVVHLLDISAKQAAKKDWSAHDVEWYLPGRKTPVGYSTRATSDMIDMLAEDGLTISQIRDALLYDDDGQRLLDLYIEKGYGDYTKAELDAAQSGRTAGLYGQKGDMLLWEDGGKWRLGKITSHRAITDPKYRTLYQDKEARAVQEFGTTKSIKVETLTNTVLVRGQDFSDASAAEIERDYPGPFRSKDAARDWLMPYTALHRNDQSPEEHAKWHPKWLREMREREIKKWPPNGFPTRENGGITGSRTAAYTEDFIARGLYLTLGSEDISLEDAQRLVDGSATVQDVMRFVRDPAGIWWGLMDRHWDMVDIENYAAPYGLEESLAKGLEEFEEEKVTLQGNDRYKPTFYGGELAVVLVAERPKDWDPDANEANLQYARNNPVMGNSFIPEGTRLNLTEVRYDAGRGWRTLPAKGITVTAQVQRVAQVQSDLEVQRTPSQGGTRHRGRRSTVPSNPQSTQTPSVRAISGVIGWPEAPSGVRRHLDPLGFPSVAEKWPTSEGQQL